MLLNVIEKPHTESGGRLPVVMLHGLFGAAGNLGAVQRNLMAKHRVLALDLRNHGDSPHAPSMDYPAMAADVMETLEVRNALPAVLMGHSMGGKVAMRLALDHPDAVARLLVSDIAPVRYPPAFEDLAAAMQSIPLNPGLTRASADAVLANVSADPAVRGFLLQNLRFGAEPHWRIGLDAIAAALPRIEDWPSPSPGAVFAGPTLFVSGARSDYIGPQHRDGIRALFPAARFVTVKNAGHWIHADNPVAFSAILSDFADRA